MKAALTNENIAKACEEVNSYFSNRKIESKDLLYIVFSVEETLLKYQKAFGSEAEFKLDINGLKIRVTVPGNPVYPFTSPEDRSDEDIFMQMALDRMGQRPYWRYKRGINEIRFALKRKRLPEGARLLITICAAVLIGVLCRQLPMDVRLLLQGGVVQPLMTTFLEFLNAVAGPMIFLSVVWGIYSIGDASTFSNIGKRLIMIMGIFLILMMVVVGLVCIPFFSLNFGESSTGNAFSSLYNMVLDIIPPNLFTPFSQGNTLQILFIAVIIGISLLLLKNEANTIASLSEQLGAVINNIMSFINKLLPIFIFGSLFNLIVVSETESFISGMKFLIAAFAGCIIMMISHIAIACAMVKIAPSSLCKKTLSTFIISITTASSAAAFTDNINTCTEKLGISKKLVNFGIPLGQILYKPGVAILFWCAALSVAEVEKIECSVTWFIMAMIVCILLSVATPPVPGGMSASFAVLFAQLGLPGTSLSIILSMTVVLDYIVTATNTFTEQCVLLTTAQKLNMLHKS